MSQETDGLTQLPGEKDLYTISDLKRNPKKEDAFRKAIRTELAKLGDEMGPTEEHKKK